MTIPLRRKVLLSVCLFGALIAMTIGFRGIAQQSAKEAPERFNTPSFNSAQLGDREKRPVPHELHLNDIHLEACLLSCDNFHVGCPTVVTLVLDRAR